MKRIALITFAGLALFATAAAAHQNGWGNNYKLGNGHMQQVGYTGGGCAMNSNIMGRGMLHTKQAIIGPEMLGNATGTQANTWRSHPSYQGQVGDTTTTGK